MELVANQDVTGFALQEGMIALVRSLGLHRGDITPCGEPVSVGEAHALLELRRTQPLSQNDLAERLELEKSTISRLVVQMETRGWIERYRAAPDRRVQHLCLTASGQSIAARLAAARQDMFRRILEAIPDCQRGAVIEALRTLVEATRETR